MLFLHLRCIVHSSLMRNVIRILRRRDWRHELMMVQLRRKLRDISISIVHLFLFYNFFSKTLNFFHEHFNDFILRLTVLSLLRRKLSQIQSLDFWIVLRKQVSIMKSVLFRIVRKHKIFNRRGLWIWYWWPWSILNSFKLSMPNF